MKKFYLAGVIFFFVLITIVFFENISRGVQMMFFGKYRNLTEVYPILITLGIGE